MELDGQVIVITGTAQGLGRKMAEIIARQGAKLALVDLDSVKLNGTAQLCAKAGSRVKDYTTDITDEQSVISLFGCIHRDLGSADAVVNNAGITSDALLVKAHDGKVHSTMSVDQFNKVVAADLRGVFLCGREAAVHFAVFCWIIATALWIAVTYGVLTMLTIEVNKPTLTEGINGGWLIIVVATQSVSILTVLILPWFASADAQGALMFMALILWLSGGGLYLWLTTLIFLRCTFLPMSPQDLTPLYWINMGSAAISTAAGAALAAQSALSPVVVELVPLVKGLTLFFWSMASWWIPMLIALGVWRYLICGVPLAYGPLYWGGVFPLGMYSASTYGVAKIVSASYLMPLSYAFMIAAIIAWMATFGGPVDSALNWERGR